MKRDVFDLYRRNGRLIYRKLLEFVPIMTVTKNQGSNPLVFCFVFNSAECSQAGFRHRGILGHTAAGYANVAGWNGFQTFAYTVRPAMTIMI